MKVAVLAGDGIGAEVTAQAVRVLRAAVGNHAPLELVEAPVGGVAYELHGDPLPPHTLDIARKAELIAATHDLEQVKAAIGADAVVYPDVAEFRELFAGRPHCFACFDGHYPTAVSEEERRSIEREKVASRR